MARKSAEERREEITEIALRHFAEGGYYGTSTEAIAREAGISQPYLFRLFRTKRSSSSRARTRVTPASARCSRRGGGRSGEPVRRDGRGLRDRLLPDRHALLFQMQALHDQRARDPRPRARGVPGPGRPVAALAGVTRAETWDFFAYGMLLNVTAGDRLPARGLEVIFPHRRAIAWARWWSWPSPPCSRCRCSASSATRTTSTTRRPRRSPPATRSTAARAPSRRRASSRWCGWAAPAESPQARERIARVRAALRDPGVGVGGGLRARAADRRLVSRDGRSTYLLATFKNDPRGARPRIEERLRDVPGSCWAAARSPRPRSATRSRGHRTRRADRVPDPLPADAAGVPQRGVGAAAAGRGGDDDPAQLPGDPDRQRAREPDVDLRPEPDQRARAGAGDRLLAVHGLAVPGGARRRQGPRGGAGRHAAHRRACRRVLGDHGRRARWRR